MKPFNLERAIVGDPLITRDGLPVTEFHYLKTIDITEHKDRDCIVFVVDGGLHSVNINGKSVENYDHPLDLFMAPIKKTYSVLVFKNKSTGKLFTVEQELNHDGKCMVYNNPTNYGKPYNPEKTYFLGAFPIEIEE